MPYTEFEMMRTWLVLQELDSLVENLAKMHCNCQVVIFITNSLTFHEGTTPCSVNFHLMQN